MPELLEPGHLDRYEKSMDRPVVRSDRTARLRVGSWLGTIAAACLVAVAPAHAADRAELHTFHCLDGCPAGAPGIDDIIVREIYTLASNDLTKLADWVAYRVTPDSIGPSGERMWRADPWLDSNETLEPDDYRTANTALATDRGHQVPLASQSGTPFAGDTNLLSNITPQGAALNQGPWQRLEAAENRFVLADKSAIHVLTGPLYERVLPPLPGADERHRVPSAYWKVVRSLDGRLTAFIMDTRAAKALDFCITRVPLEEVELRTRLEFFPRLSSRSFGKLDAALGCQD